MKFVNELIAYQGEVRCDHRKKATYHLHWAVENPAAPRVLEWFIPNSGVSVEHEAALARVVRDASERGITVRGYRVAG